MTRDAAAIGAGLAPARPARPIVPGQRLHVIGAAGAGASAAALLAHHAGAHVSGCDAGGASPYSAALEAAGIPLAWQHAPEHITVSPAPDRVAVTKALTAIDPDHPELRAATAAGIALEPWQQVVADAASGRTLVGVAGTHGKSTTAGWLVHVLVAGGMDPGAFVGALLPSSITGGLPSTARRGGGAPFVVEADEYAGNFDAYRPDVAILTGAEWDHPDVFADRAAVIDSFVAWLRGAPDDAQAVINVGDAGGAAVAERLADSPIRLMAVMLTDEAVDHSEDMVHDLEWRYATRAGPALPLLGRVVSSDPAGTTLDLHGPIPGIVPLTARLSSAGRHNASNALCVAGAALALGVEVAAIVDALGSFPGVGRRLELKGEAAGVVVYDDYGHHPTAIRETLLAVRQREPGRRIWAVYEPLTYHRTAALLPAFADALATADGVVVADIWAGRDPDTTVASAAGLAEAVARLRPDIPVEAPGSVEATADWLAHEVRDGDAVLVMGGGHSYRIADGPAATTIGGLIVDHASAADLLERYKHAWETFDGDAWTDLFTEDAEYHRDPFEPPMVGSNALRAYLLTLAESQDQVEMTVERHWAVGETVLAAWHASYVQVPTRARVRVAGFMTLDIAGDGRISRYRGWWHRRETPAGS